MYYETMVREAGERYQLPTMAFWWGQLTAEEQESFRQLTNDRVNLAADLRDATKAVNNLRALAAQRYRRNSTSLFTKT